MSHHFPHPSEHRNLQGSSHQSERRRRRYRFQVARPEGYCRAPLPMCFTRNALRMILRTIGVRPPESGALGFGPLGGIGFEVVEFDDRGSASSSGAVYSPDTRWGSARQDFHIERSGADCRLLDGIIHSHPGGMGHPSRKVGPGLGDLGYAEQFFATNETPEWFLMPILTGTGTDGVVTIWAWVCHRDDVHRPMLADVLVCDASKFPSRTFSAAWLEREATPVTVANLAPGRGPITVASDTCERERPLGGPGARHIADPPAAVPPAGTTPGAEAGVVEAPAEVFPPVQAYVRRLDGVISPAFRDKTIAVIGNGAGSYMVEKVSRLSPAELRLCDFDVVEVSNLSRTAYSVDDVGKPKVYALSRRIKAVNPHVRVIPWAADVTALAPSELDTLVHGADVVVGGTDVHEAQARINEVAVALGIPAVFIGIHARARGARIIWTVPGETGCYRCVARERFEMEDSERGETDLVAAAGSVIDIQFIDMVATKILAAILERGQASEYGRFYERMRGRNDVVVRCHPDYEWATGLWDAILGDLPRDPKPFANELREEVLLAMDSVWLRGSRDPACPVCSSGARTRPSETRRSTFPACQPEE